MKRLVRAGWSVLVSRAITPVVIGLFLLVYIALAFGSDEALQSLMKLIRSTPPLALLFSLIPLNCGARLVRESAAFMRRRRLMSGKGRADAADAAQLFEETVSVAAVSPLADQERQLVSLGYRTRRSGNALAAWRGLPAFPARLLFLAGCVCLFTGILLSVTTRSSQRAAVVEGEPLPGGGGTVERIVLKEAPGLLLARTLSVDLALDDGSRRQLGLYPPARQNGLYVYPRYLGIAPLIRLSAPDLPVPFEGNFILMLYPPGKEDSAEIPGTPYRMVMTMAPQGGGDPYVTGRMLINFRLLKGNRPVYSGSVPLGGEAAGNGYRIAFPSCSRLVAADFVRDHGVAPIWWAGVLFCLALLCWLPVRLFLPRQEMLFVPGDDATLTFSRAEGGRRAHAGSYHELLDALLPGMPGA